MCGNVRRGRLRASAHQKLSPLLHLQSPEVHYDAQSDHSLPCEKVSSETTQHTPGHQARFRVALSSPRLCARCTSWSSTNGSAAHRCSTEFTGAQPGVEAANGRGMALSRVRTKGEGSQLPT